MRIPRRRIGLLLFVLLVPATWHCFQDWIAWKLATHWKTIDGAITESSVLQVEVRFAGQSSMIYLPTVVYRYALPGEVFTRSRITFAKNRFDTPEDAAVIVGRYPVGREVAVHYDPMSPGDAVLDLTEPSVNFLQFGGLVFLGLVALAAMLSPAAESDQFAQQS